jgi:hypothetical protein
MPAARRLTALRARIASIAEKVRTAVARKTSRASMKAELSPKICTMYSNRFMRDLVRS